MASQAEVTYAEALQRSGARIIIVSTAEMTGLPEHWTAAHSSRVDLLLLQEQVPDISRRQVLVSGPPAMVDGVGSAARALHARSVRTDYFSGY